MEDNKKNLLVLTSTFPRWPDDVEPPFVYELSRRMTDKFNVYVLAPHFKSSKFFEKIESMTVYRYVYCIPKYETLAYEGGITENLKKYTLKVFLVPLFLISQFFYTILIIKKHPIDIIHAHWIFPQGFISVIACIILRKKIPIVCTSHGGDLYALNGLIFNSIKRFTLKKSKILTVVSKSMIENIGDFCLPAEKIKVISMGVDLAEEFVPGVSQPKEDKLVFVGRLVEKKGLEYLITAMEKVKKEMPNVKLHIIGGGPLKNKLKNLRGSLNLGGTVLFFGALENKKLPKIYQSAKLAVFPFVTASDGDQEGFGLVLVEAMGCGCAVITTPMKAYEDFVVKDDTAIVVPPKNADALAEAIISLLKDESKMQRLGKAGREKVEGIYDWQHIANRYKNVLSLALTE